MSHAESPAPRAKFSDYLELTKPRLSSLSVLTTLVGYLATRPSHEGWRLVFLMVGASLAAGGVAALNQWLEHETDARMKRTADRPIPAGKVPTGSAFVLGILMCVASLFLLFAKVNPLAAMFTLLTIFAYLGWYTPAKRWSRWSTEIGAVAGALPPLIGWSAGEGRVTALGWILFGVLFFWQIPHFMAIAWMYRDDYGAAGFPMLPVIDPTGTRAGHQAVGYAAVLLPISLVPTLVGLSGLVYAAVALVLGIALLVLAVRFSRARTDAAARRLFLGSLIYLPLIWIVMIANKL